MVTSLRRLFKRLRSLLNWERFSLRASSSNGEVEASRSLDSLEWFVRLKGEALIEKAKEVGIDVLIYSTYRSFKVQDAMFELGRTNAKGGESAHNHRLAFDCIPTDEAGRPIWDATPQVWEKLYKVAEEVGLDALGDPWGEYLPWDLGHFQEPGWKILIKD